MTRWWTPMWLLPQACHFQSLGSQLSPNQWLSSALHAELLNSQWCMWDYQNRCFCRPQGVTETAEHSTLDNRLSAEFCTGCDNLSSPFDQVFTPTTTLASILSLSTVERRLWLKHVWLGQKCFAQVTAQPSWRSRDQCPITAYFQL